MKLDFLWDIFFPPVCVCCERRIKQGVLCGSCRAGITMRHQAFSAASEGGVRYLIGAAGSYENRVLRSLIHALKFRFIKGAAEPLADVLYSYIKDIKLDLRDFIIIPVPLSKRRERVRGFNQAALIAQIFAGRTGLSCSKNILIRVRHKKPQSETKNLAERQENIRGCFTAIPALCAGKNILLIDDVTTSGATFREAVLALSSAGAKKIIALAVAQA